MKNTQSLQLYTILLLILTATCSFAAVVCDYSPGENAENSLRELIEDGCLGGSNDTDHFAKALYKNLNESGIGPMAPERMNRGFQALQEINDHFIFSPLGSTDSTIFDAKTNLEKDLQLAHDLLLQELSGEGPSYGLIKTHQWDLDIDNLTSVLGESSITLDFKVFGLESSCTTPESPLCQGDFTRAIKALRHLNLIKITLEYMGRHHILSVIEVAKTRSKQWDLYFNNGYPQWPWELAINGLVYKNSVKETSGLAKPPEWQLVTLHPDVIFEYVDNAEDGSQFKPALFAELIGFDAWRWKDNGKQEGPWGLPVTLGLGVIATYTDRAGSDDWGWGGILRINHSYNIGITSRGDGDVGFFVSVNLSKLITKGLGTYSEWFGRRSDSREPQNRPEPDDSPPSPQPPVVDPPSDPLLDNPPGPAPPLTKEKLEWFRPTNGDRGTWYGARYMNQYPKDMYLTVPGCLASTHVTNNGTRWERGGQAGYVIKQSEVTGRHIALIVPRGCRSKKAFLEF